MIKLIRLIIAKWKYRKVPTELRMCGEDMRGHFEWDNHAYTEAKQYLIDKYVEGGRE